MVFLEIVPWFETIPPCLRNIGVCHAMEAYGGFMLDFQLGVPYLRFLRAEWRLRWGIAARVLSSSRTMSRTCERSGDVEMLSYSLFRVRCLAHGE